MKETIESTRPREYFMELMKKKCDGKKLNQREKVFIELYINEELPCFYFVKQMKPSILNYHARIDELRTEGFIIPCKIHYVRGEKHSTYTLDKHHVEVVPYYEPLIEAQKRGRHLYWANFYIHDLKVEPSNINTMTETLGIKKTGFDLTKYKDIDKRKAYRNCVDSKLGLHIFNCAFTNKQERLF